MKNHWLSNRKQKMIRGRFQEADPVNRQGRCYGKYMQHLIEYFEQKLKKGQGNGVEATEERTEEEAA